MKPALLLLMWGGSPEPPGAQAPKSAFGRAGLETRPTELILFL